MAASTALNLSLLSRGIGEVKRNGSEKVDVIFEPQDYFNFLEKSADRPYFLPPLQPRYGFTSEPSQTSRCPSKGAVHLPKTFTTRKGALLLFSEDMAHKAKKPDSKKHRAIPGYHSERDATLSTLAEESATDRNLKTVDDLARSIMAYGNFDESGNMNLKVMTQRKRRHYDFERQIRPGFSAKRYLSTWTKTWDDTTLEKVISKGYLTEKSLFYYNPLLPHLTRRLNDDLSYYPTPYKLMRSMLMSPGSLSGYTFYRVRPESQETDYYLDMDDEDDMRTLTRSVKQTASVKVASVTMDGQLQEAVYGQLDRQSQAEVLTDLLVKGAVHYAMKTQQEYADRQLEDTESSPDEFKVVPKFDMREAVESMLQDNEQRGIPPQILDAKLPERDDRSQHSGSFKGSKLGSHRLLPRERGQGDAVPWHDDVSSASSGGAPAPLLVGQAPLPPIGQTYTQLTPIGEASREHTQAFSLPVNDEEEDEGWAGRSMVEKNVEQRAPRDVVEEKRKVVEEKRKVVEEKRKVDVDKRKARISAHSLDIEGPAVGGSTHQMSSSDSVGPGSTHSSGWLPPVHKQQWKGSQQSLKSHSSRRAYASDDSDAEVPDEWKIHGRRSDNVKKLPKRESPRSNVTEQEILDKLTSHATHIAESILSHSESGHLLEEDIRRAASLWMETHPARDLSRSQSVQDIPDKTVIQEVMKIQKRNSAGPTVADYRNQIKGNLMTALAKATGLQQSDIPQDAEIDPELLEQLANNTLTPEDIEVVRDVETGRSFIRSRNHQISAAMGGVEKGHIYQQASKKTVQWLNVPTSTSYTQCSTKDGDPGKPISIPSERKSGKIGELDIVNYQSQGEEKESVKGSKAGSEVGSKKASSSGKSSVVSPVKSSVKSDTSVQNADRKSVKSAISFKDSQGQDELQQALADLDQPEAVSVKSGKSRVSDDKKSRVSENKLTTPEKEKRDEFVVASGVDHTKENTKIYGMPPGPPAPTPRTTTSTGKPKEKKPAKAPPVGKKKVEKGKKPGKGKAKKKAEQVPEPETVIEAVSPVKELTPEPPKAESPKPETPVSVMSESVKQESDEEEEYIIVRDETMTPEPEPEPEVLDTVLNLTTSAEEEEPDEEQVSTEDLDDMSEADKLRMISNREARAAKRAAAAEKRRQEVERKRKEREEQIRREKDEHERQEVLRLEQEELRKQKEEERRLKRQREEEENEEQVREELEKVRREKAEIERERRRKEEYSRKLEMMKARQVEDEKRRQEEAVRKRLEEEERHKEEEEKMAQMAEEERMEYERKKKEEAEERVRKEAEDKKRREEEAMRALEEARRLAEEMARKQAELEARLRFNRSLQLEANGLDHTQDITNAFVFSYFEFLQWLGLDIPEFELLKLNQY